jgi:CRISPR/Cas system CSM-associated protein Csm2 small subunit
MPVIKIDNASLSKLIPTKENTTKENTTKENNMHGTKIIFNNRTFKFENIPKEKIDKWKEAFPNCNVDIELKKMEAWLAANPERRKKNYEKFIVNWLARAKGEKANGKYIPITAGKAKFTGGTANAGEW